MRLGRMRVLVEAREASRWRRRAFFEQQRLSWDRQLTEDPHERRVAHSADRSLFQSRDRRLMDADQPRELPLGPTLSATVLEDGAANDHTPDLVWIAWLSPQRGPHQTSLAAGDHRPLIWVGSDGSTPVATGPASYSRETHRTADIRQTRQIRAYESAQEQRAPERRRNRKEKAPKRRRPPDPREAFEACDCGGRAAAVRFRSDGDQIGDQIGPRPMRALPRRAFQPTTTITAPMTATTMVVMLMPVV
jgi:hypothetical protein